MEFPQFIGGSYKSQAVTADQERTVNWYSEHLESPGATAQRALYPTPGVTQLATADTGYARGHYILPCRGPSITCGASVTRPERLPPKLSDGREFLVIGNTLYEANSDGDLFEWTSVSAGPDNAFEGSVNPSSSREPVTIQGGLDANGRVLITANKHAYYFSAMTVQVLKIDALDSKASMGGFLDGYWLALDAESSTLYISNLDDVTTWDTGTDFAQRNLAPDPWRAMKVYGRYIWLFGELTTELWVDTGDRFPFAPIPNALINYGIAAPWSAQIVDNSLIWLARNDDGRICVVRSTGVNVETISTHAVELAISGYSDYSTAVSDSYADLGHSFYLIHFDESNASWAWDSKTGEWHERGTWNPETNSFTSWRPRHHAFAFGEHRILDSGVGQGYGAASPTGLYRMSSDLHSDIDGAEIRRVRRAPAIMAENKRVFYSLFELDLEPGLGLTSGQGEDPQVMLRLSNDGGKTWGPEMMRSAGKIGEYERRVRWNRMGSGRRRVFEVSVSDPIPWRLTGAYLDANAPLAR
jgi:hypothetical protein